jgi:glutamine synthetase
MGKSNEIADVTRLDQRRISHFFGCNTLHESVLRERLSKEAFKALRQCLKRGERLTPEVAHAVAGAMREWALERGATHFTHWFQPMTGATAEKHDAFIAWDEHGLVIERFSGAQLVQGEPDASSFPSGGLRATFEARGYTAWDPTSPAFLMEGPLGKTLCIPTAFIGYHGEALDHKVPLLRSMEFIAQKAQAALALFGYDGVHVTSYCGAEQEYFLIEQDQYHRRPDLLFASRTVQGAKPPKGQELEDHYFGSIKARVLGFMQDLEVEAYKLGIPVKTRHNEVAPNQFEAAPIYEAANLAADHNQLLMELMKNVAERNGFAALLHEKPFAGVNGSGKHCNWSLGTDDGHNLLEPGKTPQENLSFLFFLSAVLKGIHRHGGLLRATIASAGNDHRLGANEAPPAIMSAFLGGQLNKILDQIERGEVSDASERQILDLGIAKLPVIEKDATDRNRTSPFAFTGNKFEFRAVGASQAIAVPLAAINAVVGEALGEMTDRVRREVEAGKDQRAAIMGVIRATVSEARAVRFEGNGYSDDWKREAERRGLPHAKDTVDALEAFERDTTVQLYTRAGILSKEELEARSHIRHEQYQKAIDIEAQLLREITETLILPAVSEDIAARAEALVRVQSVGVEVPGALKGALDRQVKAAAEAHEKLSALKVALAAAEGTDDLHARTRAFGRSVLDAMLALRAVVDSLEEQTDASRWPLPKYREMLAPLT